MNVVKIHKDKWGEEWISLRQVALIMGCTRDAARGCVDRRLVRERIFPPCRVLYSKGDAERAAAAYAAQHVGTRENQHVAASGP